MQKHTTLILLISTVILLSSCGKPPEQSADKDKEEKEIIKINVEATTTFFGDAISVFKSTAVIEADRAATVISKSSGIILELLVEEGDYVEHNQVLLVLESAEQKLSVQSAQANYEKSLSNSTRAKQLIAKGLTNKENVDNLKFETRSLKAALDQAKMNLSFTKIKAPFAGVVVKRHVKIGNLIQNNANVFDIIDLDSMQAKISVPEHNWLLMKVGLPVRFHFSAIKSNIITGELARISPIIDAASGTFVVTVNLENKEKSLRPGLFAKADIVIDSRENAVLLDKSAIINEDDSSYVFVLKEDNKVEKITVKLGYEMRSVVEVLSGLAVDTEVITTGKNNLTPDSEVEVIQYND